MDLIQKELVSEEMNEIKKSCVDCKATKTPLWRGGPAGPKSLCNACGIRQRKKRRAMVGLNKGPEKKEKPATSTTKTNAAAATTTTTNKKTSGGGSGKGGNLMREDLRVRLMALGKEVVMLQRRQRSPMKRQRSSSSRKLGEEEQAAVLLMALSCGSVFAWNSKQNHDDQPTFPSFN